MLTPWLKSLPMMVKSSQPKETKREKCKCKCWKGPSGQGIADPFNDLTKEIGSRNVREQATCVQKNQQVNHLRWTITMLKTPLLCYKVHKAPKKNVGLETAFRLMEVWWEGKQSISSLKPLQHPGVVRSGSNCWMGSSRSPATAGPLALDRTRMRCRWPGVCFTPWSNISKHLSPSHSFPGHPHCPSAQITFTVTQSETTHHVKIIKTWIDVKSSQTLLWHLLSHFCKAVHSVHI